MGLFSAAEAKAVIRADNKRLKTDLAKSKSMFQRTFRGIGRGIKGAMGTALSPLGIGAGAAGLAIIGKGVLDFEEKLTRLGIQAGFDTPKQFDALRNKMIDLSKSTGISRGDIIAAGTGLINLTGDVKFTTDNIETLAKANLATGATMEDLAGLAFSLKNAFKLDTAAELQQGLSEIVNVGKRGSIPLNELAITLQSVSASFKQFKADGLDANRDLAASLQVLRANGFATAQEAGTGLQAVITALTKKSKELSKFGIKVFEKDKNGVEQFRALSDILDDFEKSKLIKTKGLLAATLGRVEGLKGIQALTGEGRAMFESLSNGARGARDLEEDAKKFANSTAGKLQKAVNNIKEALAKTFTPARISQFVKVVEKLADGLEFAVDNAGLLLGAFAAIKTAQFASMFMNLAGAIGGVGGAGGMVGGLNAAVSSTGKLIPMLGKLGSVAGVLGAAFAGWEIGSAIEKEIGDQTFINPAIFDDNEKAKSATGYTRAAASDFASKQSAFGRSAGASGGEDTLNAARAFIRNATDKGIVGKNGKIDRAAAFQAAEGMSSTSGRGKDVLSGAMQSKQFNEFNTTLQQALALVQQSDELFRRGIGVKISIDQNGKIVAKADMTRQARSAVRE